MVVLGFPVVDIMKVIGKMHRVHMENLELTQLRLVEAIAETGNLSSAAEVVGLSQSAASHSPVFVNIVVRFFKRFSVFFPSLFSLAPVQG